MKPPLPLAAICTLGLSCTTLVAQVTVESRGQAHSVADRDWTVFVHPNLGYQLPVPPGVRLVGDPKNAAKTTFISSDGEFLMSAWGELTPQRGAAVLEAHRKAAKRRPGRAIDYERTGRSWFVISGTDDAGTEFYEKFAVRGDVVAAYKLRYPRTRLRAFESWVEEIENGFRLVAPPVERSRATSRLSLASNSRAVRPSQPNRADAASEVKPPETKLTKLSEPPTKRNPNLGRIPGTSEPAEPDAPTIEALEPQKKSVAPSSDAKDLPIGERVPAKPGFVYSPYTSAVSLVDITSIPSGTKVRCPYTKKIFLVP